MWLKGALQRGLSGHFDVFCWGASMWFAGKFDVVVGGASTW